MKRLYGTLLALTLLLSATLSLDASAINYGLSGTSSLYPSLGGGSYSSLGGYGGYGSYGGYGGYGGSYGGYGGYGSSCSSCSLGGSSYGYRPSSYSFGISIRVSGYYNQGYGYGGGYGYGYGGGYGGGSCGSHGCAGGGFGGGYGYGGGFGYGGGYGYGYRHVHRGNCCRKKRARKFSLSIRTPGFSLGIRSVSI